MTLPRVDLKAILQSYSRKLLQDFQEGAKASNFAFDRGLPREKAVRDFLAARLPGRYGVGEGLVVDSSGGQSQQCDVVIFDREQTPLLSTEAAMSIWPFEAVYGVAQVKSKLTKTVLEEAVANIASFKSLSRDVNNLAGGPGFKTYVGKMNTPFGMLIAHEIDAALTVSEIETIITGVERGQQIDAYCVVSGLVGVRAQTEDKATLINLEADDFAVSDFGEGAIAAFLFLSISILNGLQLGEQSFLRYMRYLNRADGS